MIWHIKNSFSIIYVLAKDFSYHKPTEDHVGHLSHIRGNGSYLTNICLHIPIKWDHTVNFPTSQLYRSASLANLTHQYSRQMCCFKSDNHYTIATNNKLLILLAIWFVINATLVRCSTTTTHMFIISISCFVARLTTFYH